ncbi:MAG: hypothetical protein RBU37_03430 [Myxococcota bacterium]|jgi:hypothetical protein|nr:hypothetical protein [Myxococcota bacterium]
MKRFTTVCFLGLALSLLFGSFAMAQDAPKVKEISFEDDTIEGDLMMPQSTNIRGMGEDELTSLIKAREDFVDEMLKSVEDL